ncbi:hypothetical protein AGABI2DRAFT_135313 [Agaricus bisporus var. bisporus H97]|uniref:hypothetical protein n=1 Tax=Agaricus bisporus var. bisporus (strain H97 / ATCC MYA-4626 / FGSC 10389) TaxID=936046 RepID=UPI00029F62F6|nr:hypothetical protein AGABI2DRAFT_135313 [Agaricus bisporus var. bisporus H97]EKV48198.1 hypothetical protein AGABI2DRAFT_135313 [Agaricus bisporus var. bisporus H97]
MYSWMICCDIVGYFTLSSFNTPKPIQEREHEMVHWCNPRLIRDSRDGKWFGHFQIMESLG